MSHKQTMDSFWAQCIKMPSGCWEWQGRPNTKGYGTVRFNGRSLKAYRVALESQTPKPFSDAHALHKCDNKLCINPDHLYWGTNADNMLDKAVRGGTPTKLSRGEVEKIRVAYARRPSLPPLARHYSVDKVTIFNIVKRMTWKHLP